MFKKKYCVSSIQCDDNQLGLNSIQLMNQKRNEKKDRKIYDTKYEASVYVSFEFTLLNVGNGIRKNPLQ